MNELIHNELSELKETEKIVISYYKDFMGCISKLRTFSINGGF